MKWQVKIMAALLAAGLCASTAGAYDIGRQAERKLRKMSRALFGVRAPLARPADASNYVPRAQARANQRVKLARGLRAKYVTRRVARWADQMVFWPDANNPTHLILCIEQIRDGTTPLGGIGMNPSVQRVRLSDGSVETVLHGMSRCDGIRRTDWGTVLVTEEGVGGRAFEILDPLAATGHWLQSRTHGDIRDGIDSNTQSTLIARRYTMGSFAWEGIALLPSGVVIAGDEKRPDGGEQGGSIYKFIPWIPHVPGSGQISDLSQSPLASGDLYVLRVGTTDFGQGNQRGRGSWIGPVDWDDPLDSGDLTSREWAVANGATGYYRPEDMHRDPFYNGPGARMYLAITGSSRIENWGETLVIVDPIPEAPHSVPTVQLFLPGDERLNSHDNLAIQRRFGNIFILEDDVYGEVWSCLRDGKDRDNLSDGCVSVLSVTDPDAEPSGLIFDATGRTAYMVIMHGEQDPSLLDFTSDPLTGETDDLIKITGFKFTQ